jgi:hypothetical protein
MKLKLKVRFHNRGGRVSSATSTAGHVVKIVFFLVAGSIPGLGLLDDPIDPRVFLFLLPVVVMLLLEIRDAIAWLQATDKERQAFCHEVDSLTPMPPLDRNSKSLDGMALLAIATLMFGLFGFVLWRGPRPLVVIPILGWLYVAVRVGIQKRRAKHAHTS